MRYLIPDYLPVMSDCDIEVFRPDLEVIEDQSNLFIWRCQEEVSTVRVARIIAGISRRIKFSAFAGRTAVRERAAAVGRGGTRYFIFRLEGVPVTLSDT